MILKEWGLVKLTWLALLRGHPSFRLPSDCFTCSVGFLKRLVNVNEHARALSVLRGYKCTWSGTMEEAFALSRLPHYFPILALVHPEFFPRQLEWTVANSHWRSHRMPVNSHRIFVLACAIRGKSTQIAFKFEILTCIDHACSQGCLPRRI